MSDLLAARAQMGTSLAFHIIFASLGVGLPLLLCIAEGLALWRKDATCMVGSVSHRARIGSARFPSGSVELLRRGLSSALTPG